MKFRPIRRSRILGVGSGHIKDRPPRKQKDSWLSTATPTILSYGEFNLSDELLVTPTKPKTVLKVQLCKDDVARAQKAIAAKKTIKKAIEKVVISKSYSVDFPTDITKYNLKYVLGHGQYGKVFFGMLDIRGKSLPVAVKKIALASVRKRRLEYQVVNEVKIHSSLDHPHIVKLFTTFFGITELFLILEPGTNGNLYDFLHSQPETTLPHVLVAKYIVQTASALMYCHEKGIIHRDVKPENIVLDGCWNAKLSDFGWSCRISSTGTSEFCGTVEYMPPEMLIGLSYNETVDIWSLGILSYEMISGTTPFRRSTREDMISKMFCMDISVPQNLTRNGAELILFMLQYDPKRRLPLTKVIAHPWIKKNCTNVIINCVEHNVH